MSSISSISSGVYPYQTNSSSSGLGTSLQSLGTALSSGNLAAAKIAFSTLQQQFPQLFQSSSGQSSTGTNGSTTSSSSTNPNSTIQTDLQAVQSSLQSGDVSGAQTAFAKLTTDLQGVKGHHGHHGHHGGGVSSALLAATTTDSTSTTSSTDNTTSVTNAGKITNTSVNQLV